MKLDVNKVVGTLSIGALALAGCQSSEPAEKPQEGATEAAGAEKPCSNKAEDEKDEGGEHKCSAGGCAPGKCGK